MLHVLFVEDSKVDAAIVLEELRDGGFDPVCQRVETPEDMQAALLGDQAWDVILSDYEMPRFTALAAFKIYQDSGLDIPFIIVSGSIGEELAVEALHLGINDYLMKHNLARLVPAVERELLAAKKRKMLKSATSALQEVESGYRRLVDAVKEYGIFMLSPDGHIITWNTGAERILGYSRDEVLGQDLSLFLTPEEQRQNELKEGFSQALTKGHSETERKLMRKDGSTFFASSNITPVYDDHGILTGFSKILQDITMRKEAERQIRELAESLEQKVRERTGQLELLNKELESFTHSVTHDLQAPLRHLSQLSLILKRRCAQQLDAKSQEYLDYLIQGSEQAILLINNLLTLSHLSQLELKGKPVNLTEMAQEIMREFAMQEPERKVVFKVADGLVATGDPALLSIALRNLLGNAWKFTSKKSEALIQMGSNLEAGRRVFFIKDDGAGFDPNYVGKIFTAFKRLHSAEEFPGSGIGLATVQRIIHRHGGRIWAEGAVDQGATFCFSLP